MGVVGETRGGGDGREKGGGGEGGGEGAGRPPTGAVERAPWETTKDTKGLQIRKDWVNDKGEVLPQVKSDGVEQRGEGVALVKGWRLEELADVRSDKALAVVLPGLRKEAVAEALGLEQGRVSTAMVVLYDGDRQAPQRVQVTVAQLGVGTATYKSVAPRVAMVPAEVTYELVVELYHQWTTEAQVRQVETGGRMALMNMVNVVLRQGAALPSRWESYGYRAGVPGKIQVMLRTTPAAAEALMKKSGTGGIFVRSVIREGVPDKWKLALVWLSREETLTTALRKTGSIADAYGLATSRGQLAVRVAQDDIARARAAIYPDDPRWTAATRSLVPTEWYVLDGTPPGLTSGDIVQALERWGWGVVPLRTRVLRDGCTTWVVGAVAPPPESVVQVGAREVVIRKEVREQRQTVRRWGRQMSRDVPRGVEGERAEPRGRGDSRGADRGTAGP